MKNILKSKYFMITMVVLLKITMFVMLVSTSIDFKKKPTTQKKCYVVSTKKSIR